MISVNFRSTKVVMSVVLLLCALTVKADEWKEASQVVEKTTQAMIGLLEEGRQEAARNSEMAGEAVPLNELELLLGMEFILGPVVDFDSIAKGVMARFYR